MFEPFLIAFRESVQCGIVATLVLAFPDVREKRPYRGALLAGLLAALLSGFTVGYVPSISRDLWAKETWTFWRYVAESAIFYSSVVFLIARPKASAVPAAAGLFLLGFLSFVFEARAVGFLIQDIGAMKEQTFQALASGFAGVIAGFAPFIAARKRLAQLPFDKVFTLPSLLMLIGALQFGFGGVGELEKENILIPLQRGLLDFTGGAVKALQKALLLQDHLFIRVPFAGLADFLAGDRIAMTITLLFIMAPPLMVLIVLFARPDPLLDRVQAGAQRRYQIAFFRKEMTYQAAPALIAFVILVVLLHAVNISLNPLYDPPPVPIREAGGAEVLKIPLSDRTGDFSDKKLRKYVYYYGTKQIIFIAMLKPDGSVGVALDECEICRPADWNVDAKGYAQRGEHLVCKYCMTPIATSTLNNPGGCNPIPLPFKMADDTILVTTNDLISTYKKAQAIDKKGTHL